MNGQPTATDYVIGRMIARFGSEMWTRRFLGVASDVVKADWTRCLDGVTQHQVDWAMDNILGEFIPSAHVFRNLCFAAPAPAGAPKRIEDKTPRDPSRVAELVARVRSIGAVADPKAWARGLHERDLRGEPVTIAQRASYRAALGMTPATSALQAQEDDAVLPDAELRERQARTQRAVDAYIAAHTR